MKNELKLLFLPLILILTFTSLQSIGIESVMGAVDKKESQKRKARSTEIEGNFKNLKKQKMPESTVVADRTSFNLNGDFIIKGMVATHIIVKYIAVKQCLSNDSPVNLALVCRKWSEIIKSEFAKEKDCWNAWYGIVGHENEYKAFLDCVLQSQTHCLRNDWRDVFKIKEFSNPFRGKFNLPNDLEFKGIDNLFCMMTGIPRALGDAYIGKTVIWLCPGFYMQKWFEKTGERQFKQILEQRGSKFYCGIFLTYNGTADVLVHITNWDNNLVAQNSLLDLIGKAPGVTLENIETIGLPRWLVTCNIMTKFGLICLTGPNE